MITPQRSQAVSPLIIRHFEFTRLQNQSIVCAYEALLPVVTRRPEGPHHRPGDLRKAATRTEVLRSSATGA
jgi:hypothetical protein